MGMLNAAFHSSPSRIRTREELNGAVIRAVRRERGAVGFTKHTPKIQALRGHSRHARSLLSWGFSSMRWEQQGPEHLEDNEISNRGSSPESDWPSQPRGYA